MIDDDDDSDDEADMPAWRAAKRKDPGRHRTPGPPSDTTESPQPRRKPSNKPKPPPEPDPDEEFTQRVISHLKELNAQSSANDAATRPTATKRAAPAATIQFKAGTTAEGHTGRARVGATPEDIKRLHEIRRDLPAAWRDEDPIDLDDVQSKLNVFRGLMRPAGEVLEHPFGPVLLEYATKGCPVDTSPEWTMEMLEAAIEYGTHPSADSPEAAHYCREQTAEKVREGFAKMYLWEELKKNLPRGLKLSPIACIPHKSRSFRLILDLSKGVRIVGIDHPSVNDSSNKDTAPQEAMKELGAVLPRLIYAAATAPEAKGPILFAKFDIKDGYWRMNVEEGQEWNFAFVLPKLDPSEPTQIVVPSALQMGWSESPPYFCAATETTRDVADARRARPVGSLPKHPLEDLTINTDELERARQLMRLPDVNPEDTAAQAQFASLLEVYIDDFCALAQTTDEATLRHFSSAILHSIYETFPPPEETGQDPNDNPVSLKKLLNGEGVWAIRKEILGWVFDGAKRCIELPAGKADKLLAELKRVSRLKAAPRKDLEKLRGRLRHAALGIPGGRGLLSPLDHALADDKRRFIPIRRDQPLRMALADFRAMIRLVGTRPTHLKQLVADEPGYIGYCDASKRGAGGVWFCGTDRNDLEPVVWRVPWPQDIKDQVVSFDNPTGTITNSDLEMAGLLLHYLVLENLTDLKHVHVAAWCDNTPTVSWANKLNSAKSRVAARLVRALSLRIQVNEASPLITVSIAGTDNVMADVASRAFGSQATDIIDTADDDVFLHDFSHRFPLPQGDSWTMFRLPNKVCSLVISELRLSPSRMESWLRITRKGAAIGRIGDPSQQHVAWSPTCNMKRKRSEAASSPPLLSGSGQARAVKDVRSELKRFRSRYAPSARPANWTDVLTRFTEQKDATSDHSNDS